MLIKDRENAIKHGTWTDAMERKYHRWLIKEKRQLFKDFCIPFPEEIETKFYAAINNGNKNFEIYLDNLCHSAIMYAQENYTKVMYEYLCANCKSEILSEKDIKKIVGKYGFTELKNANMLKLCNKSKSKTMYKVKE